MPKNQKKGWSLSACVRELLMNTLIIRTSGGHFWKYTVYIQNVNYKS